MAYNNRYNPDALPAFAEPERKQPSSSRPPRRQSPPHHSSEPRHRPAPPQKLRPVEDDYRRPQQYASPISNQQGYFSQSQPSNAPGQLPPRASSYSNPNQQSAQYRTPQSPVPHGSSADQSLLPLFRAVDKSGNGHLSEKELSDALVNGDFTRFDHQTVRMMIRMFDSDQNGKINFDEFSGLWGFLGAWRTLFERFDVDRSGGISLDEFQDALVAFGYRLSPRFVELVFSTYDKYGKGQISFDLFVQSCIQLKRMTDVFKRYDQDRDGVIELQFEDFLTEILRLVS